MPSQGGKRHLAHAYLQHFADQMVMRIVLNTKK